MIRFHSVFRIFPSYSYTLSRGKQTAVESYDEEVMIENDEEEQFARERIIEQKRNKSRLLPQHRNMLLDQIPYQQSQSWIHETVKYKRMMYGRYGESSNINPALCWPDKVDLEDNLEYEKVAYPETLQQMMHKVTEAKNAKEAAMRARDEQVALKYSKLEQWKAELRAKTAKAEAEARAAKERKDRLVEEVRRHFGFKVDPKDERFKEMLAQKEKEDKKKQKEQRRQAREAKIAANLLDQAKEFKNEPPPN